MKKKLKQGKKYEIVWLDTFSFNGWYSLEDLIKKAKENGEFQRTVGFYAGESNGFLIFSSHYNSNPDFSMFGHPDWIPEGCVKKITCLK